MLDAAMKQQLETYLENLRTPIELQAYLDDQPKSVELKDLLNDISAASDKVSVNIMSDAGDKRVPSFDIVRDEDPDTRVSFAGLPMGHEFTSLVLALLQVGGHPPRVEEDVIDRSLPACRTSMV